MQIVLWHRAEYLPPPLTGHAALSRNAHGCAPWAGGKCSTLPSAKHGNFRNKGPNLMCNFPNQENRISNMLCVLLFGKTPGFGGMPEASRTIAGRPLTDLGQPDFTKHRKLNISTIVELLHSLLSQPCG